VAGHLRTPADIWALPRAASGEPHTWRLSPCVTTRVLSTVPFSSTKRISWTIGSFGGGKRRSSFLSRCLSCLITVQLRPSPFDRHAELTCLIQPPE
jgi:hypothetical protein